ncbi:MAG: hypothetical protein LBV23_04015 [Deltaproteobacteria bacterium]|jgi:flagellar biosynthesis GTPase FlhF|nr:hypothetical protein [Deltaproteobacteria bacterium]
MRIKRFRAKDLAAAVNMIKEEFGLSAIILSERRGEDGWVEVTAGAREEDLPANLKPIGESLTPEGLDLAELDSGTFSFTDSESNIDYNKNWLIKDKRESNKYQESNLESPFEQILKGQEKSAPPLVSLKERESPSTLEARDLKEANRATAEESREKSAGANLAKAPAAKALKSVTIDNLAPKASLGQTSQKEKINRKEKVREIDLSPRPSQVQPKLGPARGAAAYQKASQISLTERLTEAAVEFGGVKDYLNFKFEELKTLFLDLAHRQSLSEKWRDRTDLISLYRALLATGLDSSWARDFMEKAAESQKAWGGELFEHLIRTVRPAARCLSLKATIPRLLAVTGPSGVGKTTALVNLAALAKKRGLKVSCVTLDTLKLGAAEQLTQYARIMGLGFKACQSPDEAREAIELFGDSDLVLFDTSSRDFFASSARAEPRACLEEAGAKYLLALPAGAKGADLNEFYHRFKGPLLWALILTKLDETTGFGELIGFLAANGPPLAYFSFGPRTPEDFQPARADRLLELWLARFKVASSD